MHGAFFLEEKSVRAVFLIYLEFFEVFNHFLFLYGLLCKYVLFSKQLLKILIWFICLRRKVATGQCYQNSLEILFAITWA